MLKISEIGLTKEELHWLKERAEHDFRDAVQCNQTTIENIFSQLTRSIPKKLNPADIVDLSGDVLPELWTIQQFSDELGVKPEDVEFRIKMYGREQPDAMRDGEPLYARGYIEDWIKIQPLTVNGIAEKYQIDRATVKRKLEAKQARLMPYEVSLSNRVSKYYWEDEVVRVMGL